MDTGIDQSGSNIARLWVKACVLSALANTAAGFIDFVLKHALSVDDHDIGTFTATTYVALASVIAALSFVVFALLTGRVLERKLPRFPMRGWIVLHGLIGFVLGVLMSFPYDLLTETLVKAEEPESPSSAFVSVFAVGIGAVVGAVIGSAQALILRKIAHGLGLWIGCSTLAGICALLLTAAMAYAPGAITGTDVPAATITGELIDEATGFVASVLAGLILLPAVLRLRPR